MSESEATSKEIFISYCHDDNDNPLGEGWIEQFHKTLRSRPKQILGRGNEPGIWRDKELQGNQDLARVLADELRRTRVVISVLTPSYVDSAWCQREIDEFVAACCWREPLGVAGLASILVSTSAQ